MNEENMSMLYVFHSRKHTGRRIIIYARSYMEAKQAVSQYAVNDNEFDLNEFQLYKVSTDKLLKVLCLEDDYTSYQYKLSEEQFKKLSRYLVNKEQNKVSHTHTLTRNSAAKLMNDSSCLFTTKEFVDALSEHTEELVKTKLEILQMFKYVGDIWVYKSNDKIIYGTSRYQVDDDILKQPKLLIEGLRYEEITQYDIEKYNEMKRYIIENDIKEFPFTVYLNR